MLPTPEVTKLVGEFLYDQFKAIWEEALSLAGAIDELSQTYLGGEDLLFVDTRRELVEQISQLRHGATSPTACSLAQSGTTDDGRLRVRSSESGC